MDQSTSSESGYDGRGLRSAWDDDRVGRARTQPVTTRRDGGWESRRSRSPSRGPLESSKNIGDDDDGGWGGAPVETKKVEPRMSVVPRGSQGAEARWTSSERSRRSRSRSRSPRRGVSLIEDRRARDSTSTHYQPDDRRPSSSTLPTRARSPPPRLWDSTSTGSGLFGKGMRSAWDDNDAYGLRRSRSPSPRGRQQAPKQDVVKKDDDGGWGYVESTDVEETETRRSRSSASRNPPANTNQDRVPSPLIASPSVGIEPKMLSSGSGSGTLSDANGSSGYQSHSRSPTRSLESNSKPTDAKSEPTSVVSTPAEPPPRARYRRVSPPSPPRAGSRPAAPPPPPFLPPPPLPPASPLYPTRPTLPATSCSPQQERKLTETIRSMDDGGEPHRPSTAAPVFSRPSIPSHSPPAASALARSPSQISSHSTQASRRREATSPLYLSASQSVDSGRGRTERTASIGASPSIRGRSETTDLFRDDGWGLREENEDGSARGEVEEEGEEEVIDLTGSPSTPPAARPPSPTWNSPSPGSSPPSPAEEAEDVVAVKEELEPSSSKAGRVSSPAKSEQSGSSRKRPGDDEGLSDGQKRGLLQNEHKYIVSQVSKSKTKAGKRLLNERLAELTRCLDFDEEAVSEPSRRAYALLSHLPELNDKFGTFDRPPIGRHAVNAKAGRRSLKKRVVEENQQKHDTDDDEHEQQPEKKKPKTLQSTRKSSKDDQDSATASSSSSRKKSQVGGTRSDASELDSQPSNSTSSTLLIPHPVKEQSQDSSTSTMNGRLLHKKGDVPPSRPPRRRASLFTGSEPSKSTTVTTKRTASLGSMASSSTLIRDETKRKSSEVEGGEGSEMRRNGKEREVCVEGLEAGDEPEVGGDDSLFGSDE